MSDKREVRAIYANAADVEQITCYFLDHCKLEDVQEWLDEQPTLDVIPIDVHKKCMEAEIKKRVLTEKTNRQILENYAPVVHAKWIMDDIGIHRCSNCAERLPFIHCYSEETDEEWDEEIEETLYCHHCGAKIDGGKDDENA